MTANRYGLPPYPSDEAPRYAERAERVRRSTMSTPDKGSRHDTDEWHPIRGHNASRPSSNARTRRPDASPWHWLLLVPIVVPLVPSLYNRIEPTLFGLPFFYWGQLSFAFLSSTVIMLVHWKTRVTGAGYR